MTKADIIRAAAKKAGYTQEQASAILNAALEAVTDALAAGDNVTLHQFGKLEQRQHKGRTTHNFKTGESMTIPARKTVAFTPAQALKDRVNAGNE